MKWLLLLLCLAAVSCGYDRFDIATRADWEHGQRNLMANISLSGVISRYSGWDGVVGDSLVFSGRVTSSDREGNFSRVLFLEDEGAAVKLLTGLYDTWALYPVGSRIYVSARGLVVAHDHGTTVLGYNAGTARQPVGSYFYSRPMLERYITWDGTVAPVVPAVKSIAELAATPLGALVCVDGVHYTGAAGDRWADGSDRYREFADTLGGRVMVFVAAGAVFASQTVPQGEVSVSGILQYFPEAGGVFALWPRAAADIVPKNFVENE